MPFENLLNISAKKDWVDYLSALLTPTVAIFGLYIAYRQRSTEEARLRHELFERRYKQFAAVKDFYYSIVSHGDIQTGKESILFSEIVGMRFIFNREIEDHVIKEIINIASKRHFFILKLEPMPVGEERSRLAGVLDDLDQELHNNFFIFEDITLKYMQLQQPSMLQKLRQYLPVFYEKIKKAAD